MPLIFEFHYTLHDAQGRVVDTSRGAMPVICLESAGQVIEGIEWALRGMTPGQKQKISVPPELGYGHRDPTLVQRVPRRQLPVDDFKVGDKFQTGPDRHAPVVTIVAIEGESVLLDANHPLVGEFLFFEVELVAARMATPKEIAIMGDATPPKNELIPKNAFPTSTSHESPWH